MQTEAETAHQRHVGGAVSGIQSNCLQSNKPLALHCYRPVPPSPPPAAQLPLR